MNNHRITEEEVRKHLSHILKYEDIKSSQVLSRFIEFVVEKKLSGQGDEIKEYTIAVEGLGKPRDYNPQLDATVRIHAGRLRRILAKYYQETGKDESVFIDIPKGSYIPVFKNMQPGHNGEVLMLSASEQNGNGSADITSSGAPVVTQNQKPVLAILPFHNLSADGSKDYFVVGLGEQLSTDLARFQNITVISYFSTSVYKADLKDLQEMKEKIHIDYVLTGSVRFLNEVLKMNVQLLHAENGAIIFTDSYSRHLTTENIFEIQDEIVDQIANIIADDNGIIMNKVHSSPFIKPDTLSVQDAIYKYFDFFRDNSGEKFLAAITALEKAVQIEPNNATAHGLLAMLYANQYLVNLTEDRSLLEKVKAQAQTAVDLDPLSQQAQRALAWAFMLDGKKEQSFEAIDKCIRQNPKAASIIVSMALTYICQGDYVRGFKWLLETGHLTPSMPPNTKLCFALYYYHKKDYGESLQWLERKLPLNMPIAHLLHLSVCGQLYQTKQHLNEMVLALKDHAVSIINRILFDEELKKEVLHGLQIAGLTVK